MRRSTRSLSGSSLRSASAPAGFYEDELSDDRRRGDFDADVAALEAIGLLGLAGGHERVGPAVVATGPADAAPVVAGALEAEAEQDHLAIAVAEALPAGSLVPAIAVTLPG